MFPGIPLVNCWPQTVNDGGFFHGGKAVQIMYRNGLGKGVLFNDVIDVPFECGEIILVTFLYIHPGDCSFMKVPTFDIRIPSFANKYDLPIAVLTRF